jgi:hypothetical protein
MSPQQVLQVRKQMSVTRSKIRAVRSVVKQFLAEELQQCSSESRCMRTRIVMEEHYEYTVCQHSMLFALNWPTQYFWCFAVRLWHYCGSLLHEFHHQQPFPAPENSCHLLSSRQPFVYIFFSFDYSLVSTFTNKIQGLSPVTMWLRNSYSSLWYRSKKDKVEAILFVSCAPVCFFKHVLDKTYHSLA